MSESEILLYAGARGTEAVLLENGRSVEWIFPGSCAVNDVFYGICGRVHTGISALFVDIGEAHEALLPLSRTSRTPASGSRLIVQIRRLSRESDKGAVVDAHIRLPGRYAVAVPGGRGIRRSALSALPPERADRLYAQEESDLLALWSRTIAGAGEGPVPRRLLSFGDPISVALREWDAVSPIWAEGIECFENVRAAAGSDDVLRRLTLWVPETRGRLPDAYGLDTARREMTSERVSLPCGGFLVLEQTRALFAVDVNSGTAEAADNIRLASLVNREAVLETARQMRLRNLTGTILIDLLRTGPDGRESLLALFGKAVECDRGKVRFEGFTGLGLLELARTGV